MIVYSKPGCCLCEEVKEQLRRPEGQHKFAWSEINILENQDAYERFKEEIPVIFVNGVKRFQYHLDEREFLKLLDS